MKFNIMNTDNENDEAIKVKIEFIVDSWDELTHYMKKFDDILGV